MCASTPGGASITHSSMHPQGEGPVVVIHSNSSAHAMLGTPSIARVTTKTHRAKAASTLTATLFMVYPLPSRSSSARRQHQRHHTQRQYAPHNGQPPLFGKPWWVASDHAGFLPHATFAT